MFFFGVFGGRLSFSFRFEMFWGFVECVFWVGREFSRNVDVRLDLRVGKVGVGSSLVLLVFGYVC